MLNVVAEVLRKVRMSSRWAVENMYVFCFHLVRRL